ncbi:MAG TPA: hypothetical protein VGW78_07040 [Candidatus Babeliales bacterium]|jgi:hypothetical protein|nr:hypothetical protein [Candidatus Babeliales bacterium]
MIKKYLNIAILFVCQYMYTINDNGIKQIPNNLIERASLYEFTLKKRFDKKEPNSILHATKNTIADFTPLIGLAIAKSGTCEKLINKTSISESNKKIITKAIHNALRSNFALYILYLGKSPYKDVTEETKHGPSTTRFPDYDKNGIPRISPLLTSAGSIGIYVLTDVGLQVGVTKIIQSVPAIATVCKTINNKINIAPETYSSIISFGIAALVQYWISK